MSLIIEVLVVDLSFTGDDTTDRTKAVIVHRLVWIRQKNVNGWLGIEGNARRHKFDNEEVLCRIGTRCDCKKIRESG